MKTWTIQYDITNTYLQQALNIQLALIFFIMCNAVHRLTDKIERNVSFGANFFSFNLFHLNLKSIWYIKFTAYSLLFYALEDYTRTSESVVSRRYIYITVIYCPSEAVKILSIKKIFVVKTKNKLRKRSHYIA